MDISLEETLESLTFGVELEMKLEGINYVGDAIERVCDVIQGATSCTFETFTGHMCSTVWKVKDGRLKGWQIEKDGSVSAGCEVVSPVLTVGTLRADVPFLCELLASIGAKTDSECGFHIHVGRKNRGTDYDSQFSCSCIKNLVAMFEANYNLIFGSCEPSGRNPRSWAGNINRYLKDYLVKTPTSKLSLEKMKQIFYDGNSTTRNGYYDHNRYAAVNLHSLWYEGRSSTHTLEIRIFNGTVDADEIVGRCLFIGALVHQADTQRSCSFEPKQTDNPKFAMRTWLTRIGLNGDAYKVVRTVMTRNLSGCSAWRSGVNGCTLADIANA